MDVQTLEVNLGLPRLPRLQFRPTDAGRRHPEGPGGGSSIAGVDRRAALLAFTGAVVALGLGALAWVTVTVPVLPAIDPGLEDTVFSGPNGGVLLWIALGLVGSMRVLPGPGGVVWTFHFPFIAAAMVLGGPTAGAWVAFLATVERRELATQPWYGVLANHAVMALGAVVGGMTVLVLDGALRTVIDDERVAALAATAVGTIVLGVAINVVASATVMLREGLVASDLIELLLKAFGRLTLAEIGLAWVFTIAFTAVGWWAPLVLAVVVLAVWPGETEGLDALTGLPRLRAFERALDARIARVRRGLAPGGVVCFIDLDGFGRVNKDPALGFEIGNEVLTEISARIRRQIRASDLAARLGGDEFAVYFSGTFTDHEAVALAKRLMTSIRRPVLTTNGVVEVGASIGLVVVSAATALSGREAILRGADRRSQDVKRAGGGVLLGRPEAEAE